MSILASDILGNCKQTLNDPAGKYWDTPSFPNELLGYLNQYCNMAVGYKPDLATDRFVMNLAPGINQVLPASYMQILDVDFAGNGQAVFLRTFDQLKHSKFANLASVGPVQNVNYAAADPRDPKRFYVWPAAVGGSGCTLQVRAAKYITFMTASSDTYPIGQESQDSAYWYVLALAFRKTCDRQDLDRAAECYKNAMAFFPARTQGQLGEAPRED